MGSSLNPKKLESWILSGREADFMVVDIRGKEAYGREHIPGAVHIPAMEVISHPLITQARRKLVFYCRNGKRSKAALIFAEDAGVPRENLFNLEGGICAYNGEILMDLPRVETFPHGLDISQVMERALALEKGAFLFYKRIQGLYGGGPLESLMMKMAGAEVAHGKAIFRCLERIKDIPLEFDVYFDQVDGNIFEGGKTEDALDEILEQVDSNNYLDLLDFAIEMEVEAYDLYRNMAEKSVEPPLKEMFLTLAQAEKNHIRDILKAQGDDVIP